MYKKLLALSTVLIFFVVAIQACTKEDPIATITPTVSTPIQVLTVTNSITNDTALLGQALFWDPIMSGNKDVACATCHHPNNVYTDGLDLPLGTNAVGYGQGRRFLKPNDVPLTRRNTPTILNAAFNGMDMSGRYEPLTAPMFWDSRAKSLENQLIDPLTTFEEMRGHAYTEAVTLDSLVARLTKIAE